MARCIFEGLTPKQAIILADWFEGQGEQDCDAWFYEQDPKIDPPLTNVQRSGGFMEVLDNGDVIVYCYTP